MAAELVSAADSEFYQGTHFASFRPVVVNTTDSHSRRFALPIAISFIFTLSTPYSF